MNREELIRVALSNQRQLALETSVTPPAELPTDLLVALVDLAGSADADLYRLHGFTRANQKLTRYWHAGQKVDVSPVQLLSGARRVAIRPYTGFIIRMDDERRCHQVPAAELTTTQEIEVWWFAVVEGNSVCLERDLRDHGFPRASAGSPTYVAVRRAEESE